MSRVNYTKRLREEYVELYKSCQAHVSKFETIDSSVDKILAHRSQYESVADTLGIPWYFIAAIHNMESSQNFSKHLHNGDPLSARTKHVPAGRPKTGMPPFSWEESAIDALKLRKLH